jgi:hypothetical protein
VWRSLNELRATVKESFKELKDEIDSAVEAKTSALKVRVERLERIVYGGFTLAVPTIIGLIVQTWRH